MRPAKRIGKLTTTRATASATDHGPSAKVLAAGTLPWRIKGGQLQVLVIHRPEYDDWSWPKGRLGQHETLPETAWRETKEEVGLSLPLGVPLGVIKYQNPHAKHVKEVWYWAARVVDKKPRPDSKEVDETRWVTVDQARRMLTKTVDQEPLTKLVTAYDNKQLSTIPFIVLRQAKPIPAESWTKDEVDRPLADSGYTQAKAVSRLLRAWRPTRVVASKYQRSLETIAPYVKKHGGKVRTKRWLNIKTAAEHPHHLQRRLHQELKRLEPTVLCSQPSVVKRVLKNITALVRNDESLLSPKAVLGKKKTNLAPGSILVVQRAKHQGGRIVSVERYEPLTS